MRAKADAAGWRGAIFSMADCENDPEAPVAARLYIPPGQVLPRHTHDCHRVEVIIEVSLDIGDRVHGPGDVSRTLPGQFYGPHTAGANGSLSVEIFSAASGMPSRTPDGIEVELAPSTAER